MTPEFKAKWLADLRSGIFPQVKGYLATDRGYCCLGVALCTLGVAMDTDTGRAELINGDLATVYEPLPIAGQLPLHEGQELSDAGRNQLGISMGQASDLMNCNDQSDNFDRAIEYIAENL